MASNVSKIAAEALAPKTETAKVETAEVASVAPVETPSPVLNDWDIVDGEWKRVAVSSMVDPKDRETHDLFAIPSSITSARPEFDFMHGGTERNVMTRLRAEGWVPYKGKGAPGVEMRDGIPHVLGPDAPLMCRPKAVAHRFSPVATEDVLQREAENHIDHMNEITREWAKHDRTVDPNSLAYVDDPRTVLELQTHLGNGDPELGAVLLNERAQRGANVPDLERREGRGKLHNIPMSDDLAASLRASREMARQLMAQADALERSAMGA